MTTIKVFRVSRSTLLEDLENIHWLLSKIKTETLHLSLMCIMPILGSGIWQEALVVQDLVGKVYKRLGHWQLCAHVHTEVAGGHRTCHRELKTEKLSANHVSISFAAYMKAFVQRKTRTHWKAHVCSCICEYLFIFAGVDACVGQEARNWHWVSLSIARHFDFWGRVSHWTWRAGVHWFGLGRYLSASALCWDYRHVAQCSAF